VDSAGWSEYPSWREERVDRIPMDQWGQDHWFVFNLLITSINEMDGVIDNRKMRCDSRIHREFAHQESFLMVPIPTVLRDGTRVLWHDDWSCLEDMLAIALFRAFWRLKTPEAVFGSHEVRVQLLPLGEEYSILLQQHRESGGLPATFTPRLKKKRGRRKN
jgi:hypothetical protein